MRSHPPMIDSTVVVPLFQSSIDSRGWTLHLQGNYTNLTARTLSRRKEKRRKRRSTPTGGAIAILPIWTRNLRKGGLKDLDRLETAVPAAAVAKPRIELSLQKLPSKTRKSIDLFLVLRLVPPVDGVCWGLAWIGSLLRRVFRATDSEEGMAGAKQRITRVRWSWSVILVKALSLRIIVATATLRMAKKPPICLIKTIRLLLSRRFRPGRIARCMCSKLWEMQRWDLKKVRLWLSLERKEETGGRLWMIRERARRGAMLLFPKAIWNLSNLPIET